MTKVCNDQGNTKKQEERFTFGAPQEGLAFVYEAGAAAGACAHSRGPVSRDED